MLSQREIRHGTSQSLPERDISSPMPIRPAMILKRPESHNAEQAAEAVLNSTVMRKRPQLQKPEQAAESIFMLNVLSAQTVTLRSLMSAQTAATIESLKLEASEYSTPEGQENAAAMSSIDQATTNCKTVYRTHSLSLKGLGELPSGDLSLSELTTNMLQHVHAEKTTPAAQATRLSMLRPMKAAHLKPSKNQKTPSHSIIPTYDDTTDTLCWWSIAMNGPRDAAEQPMLQQCSDAASEENARDSMTTAWWNVPPGLSVISRAVAKHRSSRPVSPTKHDAQPVVHRLSTIIEVDSAINSAADTDRESVLSSHKLNLLSTFKSPRSSISSTTAVAKSSSSTASAKRPDSGYADLSAGCHGTSEEQVVATAPVIQRPAKACLRIRHSANRSGASSDSSESSMSMKSSSSSSRYFSAKHSPVASCNVEHDGDEEVVEAGGVAL